MNDAVVASASGMEVTKPQTMEGILRSVNDRRGAMRALANKLVDKYDKNSTPIDAKYLKGKKSLSLKDSLSNFKTMFKGSPVNSNPKGFNGGSILAVDEKKVDKDKKSSNKSAIAAIPKFNMPSKSGNGFDFDLDDESGGSEILDTELPKGEEESLADFKLNENDIIDKPEANIFKVISNRYLRSYPVLLEENVKQ